MSIESLAPRDRHGSRSARSAAVSLAGTLGLLGLAVGALDGCGPAATPAEHAPASSNADVVVTFDGKRQKCIVSLKSEPQGSTIACADVVPFVRDELRVPSGASYDTRTVGNVDPATTAQVDASLKGAGYKRSP